MSLSQAKEETVLTNSRGLGVTQLIREKLNFSEESKWKRFSARRLELIDTLALSNKKASEQDEDISRVANQLREEYMFPIESLPDFDKLVRAAIQSARRNRKRAPRSRKKLLGANNNNSHPIPLSSNRALFNSVAIPNNSVRYSSPGFAVEGESAMSDYDQESAMNTSSISPVQQQAENKGLQQAERIAIKALVASGSMSVLTNNPLTTANTENDGFTYASTNMPSSLVSQPHIYQHQQLQQQPQQSQQQLPVTQQLQSHQAQYQYPPPPSSSSQQESGSVTPVSLPSMSSLSLGMTPLESHFVSACDRLVLFIHRSKSCSQLNSKNLEALGGSIIVSAVSFILERHFVSVLSNKIIDMLREKLTTDHTMSFLVTSMKLKPRSEPSVIKSDTDRALEANFLKMIVGCCVRDFGFDAIVYALGNIFHEMINLDYPSIMVSEADNREGKTTSNASIMNGTDIGFSDNSNITNGNAGLNNNNNNNSNVNLKYNDSGYPPSYDYGGDEHHNNNNKSNDKIMPATSLRPAIKPVTLKFLDNKLNFTFASQGQTPPTITEIIDNGKSAFHIIGDNKVLRIKDSITGRIIESDYDLTVSFNAPVIELELIFPSDLTTNSASSSRFQAKQPVIFPPLPQFERLL